MKIHKNDFDGNLIFGGKMFHEITHRNSVLESVSSGAWGDDFFEGQQQSRKLRCDVSEFTDKCPNCLSTDIFEKLNVRGLGIYQCMNCCHGFQNPMIREDCVADLYKNIYVMDEVYETDVAKQLDTVKFQYGIQLALKYNPSISSALDVGCGTGLSLDVYSSLGIEQVVGIDPGKYTHSPSDDRIANSFLKELTEEYNDLELVTMWDTLEHIHDVKKMLSSTYSALKPGGICLVLVPNFFSLATRLMRDLSPVFQIDHLHYFSAASLEHALNSCGLSVVHKETVISELDNSRNYLEFNEPYNSKPVNEPAFGWLSADYIHSNMLGSRLLLIAQKQ